MKKLFLIILSFIPYYLYAPPATIKDGNIWYWYYLAELPGKIEQLADIKLPKDINIKHLELLDKRADSLNIPKRILFRLVFKESTYDPYAVSPKRAFSYMQIIPETFKIYSKKYNYKGRHTPEMNIIFGTQLYYDLNDYWINKGLLDNKVLLFTLASYNAGKKKVIRYKGVPPYKETKEFIKFILQ